MPAAAAKPQHQPDQHRRRQERGAPLQRLARESREGEKPAGCPPKGKAADKRQPDAQPKRLAKAGRLQPFGPQRRQQRRKDQDRLQPFAENDARRLQHRAKRGGPGLDPGTGLGQIGLDAGNFRAQLRGLGLPGNQRAQAGPGRRALPEPGLEPQRHGRGTRHKALFNIGVEPGIGLQPLELGPRPIARMCHQRQFIKRRRQGIERGAIAPGGHFGAKAAVDFRQRLGNQRLNAILLLRHPLAGLRQKGGEPRGGSRVVHLRREVREDHHRPVAKKPRLVIFHRLADFTVAHAVLVFFPDQRGEAPQKPGPAQTFFGGKRHRRIAGQPLLDPRQRGGVGLGPRQIGAQGGHAAGPQRLLQIGPQIGEQPLDPAQPATVLHRMACARIFGGAAQRKA